MVIQTAFAHPLRSAAIAALIAASTALTAGSTIRITNNSNQPWSLRISEDPSAPVMAQGSNAQTPVELSPQQKLVYRIQPGETCTLQFKDTKDLPLKKDLGLVDKDGTEKGMLRFESRQAGDCPTFSPCSGESIQSSVAILAPAPKVLTQDREDEISINAATWN